MADATNPTGARRGAAVMQALLGAPMLPILIVAALVMGLAMPGVLVEVGFIDHPSEGPELLRPAVQRSVAEALARGIIAYLDSTGGQRSGNPGGVARR